jgi:hypothetical protein
MLILHSQIKQNGRCVICRWIRNRRRVFAHDYLICDTELQRGLREDGLMVNVARCGGYNDLRYHRHGLADVNKNGTCVGQCSYLCAMRLLQKTLQPPDNTLGEDLKVKKYMLLASRRDIHLGGS